MNAASILKYLVDKKKININIKHLKSLSKKIGSDVIVGMYNKPIIFSKDEVIRLKKKINLYLVILKPNFGCSTKKIYSKVKKYSKPLKNIKNKLNNLGSLKNDLQDIVIKKYPELKKPIEFLENQPGINFVKMTGSGSCFVAYSKSRNSIINSFKKFRKNYPKYWSVLSKTI